MSKLSLLLLKEHGNEHDLSFKKQYSEPKIYTANDDLSVRWYVYYSFRNPIDGKLTRQKNVYLGVNRFKTLKERTKAIEGLRKKLLQLLENGFNPYETQASNEKPKNYTVTSAIEKYNEYLSGEHEYVHRRKIVSKGHRDEAIRFCRLFSETLEKTDDIKQMRIEKVSQNHVANFYSWAETHYGPSTFNKCMSGLKSFFDFLINVEEIEMKNPFETYVSKSVQKSDNETLTKNEFDSILKAVDNFNLIVPWGKKNTRNRSMYQPYLKDGFRLFLLTGGRREEVVDLKWSDILITENDVQFFKIQNLKVVRSNNAKGKSSASQFKHIPINSDLMDLLNEMGYNDKKYTSEYILFPQRDISSETIKTNLSRSFTHYRKGAGINKEVSLKNLRKTYISWVNHAMGKDTGKLTSHSTEQVLEKHYIDPKILTTIEEAVLKVKIFG
ncbi:tyrosine-type recombinase/integrase [Flavobacterium sp. GCM10023249]|uniref:tyrosine-type recombinase/integrase n=1 Tax=unclassified Flavobacterium TaxID=196869 RepID=UPI00360618B1